MMRTTAGWGAEEERLVMMKIGASRAVSGYGHINP